MQGDAAAWAAILGVLSIHFAAAASPGPNFMICTRNTLARSRAAGLATVAGIVLANSIFITLGFLGVIAILGSFDWLLAALKIAGGLYIAWLGIQVWRGASKPLPVALDGGVGGTLGSSFRQGLVTNLFNVKAFAYYFSFFAIVYDPQMALWAKLTMAGLMLCVTGTWYCFVVLFLSVPGMRRAYGRAKAWIDRGVGCLLLLFGARIALG